ncbi:hypothetical protein [Sulfurimonas sp.]|uniref:hypothetical protein n=1 Tax=Sulfurimonas sp. TaxID=2022749 RepID=UPI003569CD12
MKNFTLISLILTAMLAFTACSSKEAAPQKKAEAAVAAPVAKEAPVASITLVDIEKEGFLSTDKCVEAGAFQDCYLQNYICGSDDCYKKNAPGVFGDVQIVLYNHKDGITYKIDISKLNIADLDGGINRNNVTIIGKYDESTQTIHATEFKAPPPPKKSFFKGCL